MVKRNVAALVAVFCASLVLTFAGSAPDRAVQVVDAKAQRRVDVTVGGKPFTSYIYPERLQKPVLYPIRSASGTIVTRGFPLEPKPGETADHPHHVGHWFNYGDVNGYDFWGHSDDTPAANKPKMGTIVHTSIESTKNGEDGGDLVASADWKIPDGSTLLKEQVRFTFAGSPGMRTITRVTRWTATDKPVTFGDTKEGAFGIRVARELEQPSNDATQFVGPDGKAEAKPRVDTTGTTGHYMASDGKEGDAVWGTRGPWMALTGTINGERLTLAIFDARSNYGHPTYWHARGYGLFAANPFGRKGYDPTQEATSFTLVPGKSITFRHRIVVADGHLSREDVQKLYSEFAR